MIVARPNTRKTVNPASPPLTALVRLLARQAAQAWAEHQAEANRSAPPPRSEKELQPRLSTRCRHSPAVGGIDPDSPALDRRGNAAIREGARRTLGFQKSPRKDAVTRTAQLVGTRR
jgi:hypothetical protein